MSVNRALTKLVNCDGVYDLFVIDRSLLLQIELLESPKAEAGYVYHNLALEEARGKNMTVCVFSKNFLEEPTEMLTVLTDDTGEIYGHDVPKGMSNPEIHDGALWVSDSFIMYPNLMPKSELKFVIRPHPLTLIGASEGVCNVTAYNPSRMTDRYLKNIFGFKRPRNATSTIVSMDFL